MAHVRLAADAHRATRVFFITGDARATRRADRGAFTAAAPSTIRSCLEGGTVASSDEPSLEVRVAADGDAYVVAVSGELDIAGTDELRRELARGEDHPAGRIVLDLSALQFMDSAGLAVLLEAQQRAQTNGHRLTLLRGPAEVHRFFVLTGTEQTFDFDG
jgi:anti-sigma B factor antagonist